MRQKVSYLAAAFLTAVILTAVLPIAGYAGAELVPLVDFGDAPDSTNSAGLPMSAYAGVQATYPTVASTAPGSESGPFHVNAQLRYVLGRRLSPEQGADAGIDSDGANNIMPAANSADHDAHDDGFVAPVALTHCSTVEFQVAISSMDAGQPFPQRAVVNLWMDFDRSGGWGQQFTCADGTVVQEWAVQNHVVTLNAAGLQVITLPGAMIWNDQPGRDMWVRVSVASGNAPGATGAGPVAGYEFGETEDYLLEDVNSLPPVATLPLTLPEALVADVPIPPLHLPLVTTAPPPRIPPGPGDIAIPSGRLQEVDVAHIGGTGPARPLVVSVVGTGSAGQLASWAISTQNMAPQLLKVGPNLLGFDHKLHVLTPELSPKLDHEILVSALILDGTLWLTTWRIANDGALSKLDERGYGANADVDVEAYTIAHRQLAGSGDQRRFQVVTPLIHNGTVVRMVTWEVNGVTGAINGKGDSGDANVGAKAGTQLAASFGAGEGFVVNHFNVSLRSSNDRLLNLFWDVPPSGVPTLRGVNSSGLNTRGMATGSASVALAATDVDIAPIGDTGFVSAVEGTGDQLRMHVWENLPVACAGACQYAPSNIADNSLDLNQAGPGVQLPAPTINTLRAMLRDPLYGEDVWSKNPDQVQAVASVRKVMVAIVALEQEDGGWISMNDDVTVSADAAAVVGSGASNMGLVEGEVISLHNLMLGNLMVSGGDATWAISEEAGNTVEGMVGLMNLKATALGLNNTEYCTQGSGQGFSSVGYSTARDQALLWESVWDDAEFLSYAGASSEVVCGEVGGAEFCHPAIPPMTKNLAVYPNVQGHKTGGGGGLCTDDSQWDGIPTCVGGGCVTAQATRIGRPLVASLLQPSNLTASRWPDLRTVYDYGYQFIFTPDFRQTSGNQGGTAADFGIDYLSDSHGLSAALTGEQTMTLCNWSMQVSGNALAKSACSELTVKNLAPSTRVVPPTELDLLRISQFEATGDYLLGRLEGTALVLRLWRIGEHD